MNDIPTGESVADPQLAKARAVGDAIAQAVTDHKVKEWLAGSEAKGVRPTLADLAACGYTVVRSDSWRLRSDFLVDPNEGMDWDHGQPDPGGLGQ